MTNIQSKIEAATQNFTNQLIAILQEAFSSVASDISQAAPAPRAAKAAPKAAAGRKPAAAGRRPAQGGNVNADADRVVKLLAANKSGLRMEQINKALNAGPNQLLRPIQALLDGGKIRRQGKARGTTYFAA
jgi:hypothetical protein